MHLNVHAHIVPVTLMHTLQIQPFFFFPGPPNLIISLQEIHIPQSLRMHPLHLPHLVLLTTPKGMHAQASLIPLIKLYCPLPFFCLLAACSIAAVFLFTDRCLLDWQFWYNMSILHNTLIATHTFGLKFSLWNFCSIKHCCLSRSALL